MYRAASYRRTTDRYVTQSPRDYNLKFGNLHLSLTGTMDVEWNDNVNLSDTDEEDDTSISPGLQLDIYWPLNPSLVISSGISAQYNYYTGGEGEDGLEISGTKGALSAQLIADLKLGQDGTLTASEEYSRNVDTIEIRAVQPNSTDYTLNRNILGLQYRNEFNPYLSGTIKATHTNQWTDQNEYDTHDMYSDFLDVVLLKQINRSFQLGPYARAGMYRYTADRHNDSNEYSAGVAFVYQKTQALALTGSVGWQKVTFDGDNTPGATEETDNITYQVAARYSNSEFTTHLLSVNYGANQGTLARDVNYAKQLGVDYTLSWEIYKDIVLNGNLGYVNTRESDNGENSDFYSAGIGTGYRLTQQTTISLYYTHEWKDSNMDVNEYTQNRVQLSLSHRF
jgi:hypothetical protein